MVDAIFNAAEIQGARRAGCRGRSDVRLAPKADIIVQRDNLRRRCAGPE